MTSNRAVFALLMCAATAAAGCAEDVGPCPVETKGGQDTVLVNGEVQYGGQAIMNQSCAAGICHSSKVKGKARYGAPAGLDFDLQPVSDDDIKGPGTNSKGVGVAVLNDEDISHLRARQRKVFEERNRIWQQVKDGEMPPDGVGQRFKQLMSKIFDTDDATPCTAARNGYMDITTKATQDVLRTWLACETPIVEVSSTAVAQNGVGGKAGFQYQVCEDVPNPGDGGASDGGGAGEGGMMGNTITLETIIEDVFNGEYSCNGCHPGVGGPDVDLSSADKAYETMVMKKDVVCVGKPFVTPGDPTKSYLYDLVSMDEPACDPRMPLSGEMSAGDIKKVEDWIKGGALREADVKSLRRSLASGLDAGVR